jgi:hypothetical protein
VPINQPWAFTVLLLAGCSSTSKILGSDDAASDGQGGSAGLAQAGSSGASGAAGAGSGGTAVAGSSGSAGSNGTAGSAGSTPDASVDGAGSGGSAGAGDGGVESGCVLTDVTVDFAALGTVRRARLDQRGVSLVGLGDLQFSARDAGEPDAGLGVVGGYWDWSIDSNEFVTVTFTRPATNVKIFVTHALDVNNDSVYGKSAVTGYGVEGQSLGQLDIAGYGSKNISALFGDVPLSRFMVKDDVDGIAVGSLSFTACLD